MDLIDFAKQFNGIYTRLWIGTYQDCDDILELQGNQLEDLVHKILVNTDKVMCQVWVYKHLRGLGASATFKYISSRLLENKSQLIKFNPNLTIAGNTGWKHSGTASFVNSCDFGIFWREANNWASKNKMLLYMDSAIDITVRENGQRGWWRLQNNNLIRIIEGYAKNANLTCTAEEGGSDTGRN